MDNDIVRPPAQKSSRIERELELLTYFHSSNQVDASTENICGNEPTFTHHISYARNATGFQTSAQTSSPI